MTDSEAIEAAQGAARCLTYNDDKPQAKAKHMLLEMAHRLGAKTLRVRMQAGRMLLVTAFGQSRAMTLRERVLYRMFGVVPAIEEQTPWPANKIAARTGAQP
jgi:ribosomal protein S11